MSEQPIVLGINRTQDASICLLRGSRVLAAIQKERLTRRKHHWGKLDDLRNVYRPIIARLDRPVDALVECYSSDAEFARLAEYEAELGEVVPFASDAKRALISHHLAHLYSVFHPSPFDEAGVMIVDGQGSPASHIAYHFGDEEIPGDWREVSSFYEVARGGEVRCVGKQFWNGDEDELVGLGMFYFLLTNAIYPRTQGNEGKVMGLAPYGDPFAFRLPPLEVRGAHVRIPAAWQAILREKRFRWANVNGERARFEEVANLAAAGQRAFEDAAVAVACWLHERTGAENLCFAGGTALNVSTNDRLLRETPFARVFIPPAPSDAGTSLGCAMYGLDALLGCRVEYRWSDDFLGPEPEREAIDAALRAVPELAVETPDDLVARVVDLLAREKVVGLYQGRSEFGPRALGHRSILADPRPAGMRDWINAKVKGREWFRPLAPIVLLEHAERYFDLCRPSPFMQFAAPVRPEAGPAIPAVTHVDGTARLQTVAPDDDPFVRGLLVGFFERTGIPVLLNTSFNGQDEPIVELPEEAVASFVRMPLHALVIPPYLVRKRVEPEAVV